MGAYAWYYNDHINCVSYWAYSYEYSTTGFAEIVSLNIGRQISASDTSYASGEDELRRHQRGMSAVHV